MKKAERIRNDIRPTVEAFLNHEPNYTQYKKIAEAVGYDGDEPDKVKSALFSVNDQGQIGFVVAELNDMFFEFQLIRQLLTVEPYKTILEEAPERKDAVMAMAKKIVKGEEISDEDVEKVIKGFYDE